MARPSLCLWVSATPAHSLRFGILLHPRQHQDHDHELLPGHAHVLCTEESHYWLATTGSRDRNGMLHFPILFVAALEVILIGARQVVGGVRLPAGQRLPPLRSYMDDITCLLRTTPCTSRLLKRLDELIIWARMKFKPQKSRSLSLRKGERNDRVTFTISGEDIPRIVDQPIRSLGRLYTSGLSRIWGKSSFGSCQKACPRSTQASYLEGTRCGVITSPCTQGWCGLWSCAKLPHQQ